MKQYFELCIDETGRNTPKEEAHRFNTIIEHFDDLEKVKEYLIDRYDKIPNGRKKVFVDTKDGETKIVGFLHSFWNQDYSHNSKKWFQTDWICIGKVEETRTPIINL